jgi:hypothetical protein
MYAFIYNSLNLSIRILPSVTMLYAALVAILVGNVIVFRDYFNTVWWLALFFSWPLIVLMQMALIREGLVSLGVTGRPEASQYFRSTLKGMILSVIQIGIVLGFTMFAVLAIARESGVLWVEYQAFGVDYVFEEATIRNPSDKASGIILMATAGIVIFSTLTSAILTIPMAAQAANVDGERTHSLLYGAAFKSFQVIMTWIIGNLIFYAMYIGVALIFSFGISLKVPKEVLDAFLASPDLVSFSNLSQYSMIDFISGVFIFVMLHIWWTSMWAASSAVAYAEQRIDDGIRYRTHMDSYRHSATENANLRQLRKDREQNR